MWHIGKVTVSHTAVPNLIPGREGILISDPNIPELNPKSLCSTSTVDNDSSITHITLQYNKYTHTFVLEIISYLRHTPP